MDSMERIVPAVALRGLCFFPGTTVHFDISRKKSLKAVEEAMKQQQMLFLVTQKDAQTDEPVQEDLYAIGILAEVKQVIKLQNNIVRVLVNGICRARLCEITECSLFLETRVQEISQEEILGDLVPVASYAMTSSVQETFGNLARVCGKIPKDVIRQVNDLQDLEKVMDVAAGSLPVHYSKKQQVLSAVDLEARYETLLTLMFKEIEAGSLKNELQAKVKENVDKHQKEYLLREELGVIREELGETVTSDADRYQEQLDKLPASAEVKEAIEKEIRRFRSINGNAAESNVSRTYIETLLELPWDKASEDNNDLDRAQEILDRDHYGLDQVKDRILDFLAVRNLTAKGESPIICLVGPPGTGKTSIARSVAEALNKKYVRVCLGGVHDEAEIRGHRRTYVGAMPGRIVEGIKQAGVRNPLMLLDEIDKVSSDYKGDVSSSLLEVLDGEQNVRFRDHYVEIPMDLSEVLFICTANNAQAIPGPLYDRMEVIEVSGYTENEKFHIAKEHLVAKQEKANGILPNQLSLSDQAIRAIIRDYTREAGVRSLERRIGEVCRKSARQLYQKKVSRLQVTNRNLEKYLGKPKYRSDLKNEENQVGIVRGLAWTAVGGVTLEVEVNVFPGKGNVTLTGKLGDVMKESAQAGISCLRAIAGDYEIPDDYFQEHDVHIHIPEGATPKDGPSAGITMATAVLSAITGRPVRADLAMTGEITIRGRVLPIGGLKEKLLAAKTAGIRTVCIPEGNARDLEELSTEITGGLEIVPVKELPQVLAIALV